MRPDSAQHDEHVVARMVALSGYTERAARYELRTRRYPAMTVVPLSEAIPEPPERRCYLPIYYSQDVAETRDLLGLDPFDPFEADPEAVLETVFRAGFAPEMAGAVVRPPYGAYDTLTAIRRDDGLYVVATNARLGYLAVDEILPYDPDFDDS